MANTSAIWQQAAQTTYYHLLAQEQYKRAYLLMKNIEEFSEEKNNCQLKNEKIEQQDWVVEQERKQERGNKWLPWDSRQITFV